MRLASIATYPVKGCRRVDQQRARVEPWGLAGDRRWLVGDSEGRMLTQRDEPGLIQLRPSVADGSLLLRKDGSPDLTVPAGPGDLERVTVWRTTIDLCRVGEDADAWLSAALGRKARLYYLDDPTRRPVNPAFATPGDRVNLADGYPVLLTNRASLDALNDWVAQESPHEWPLPMTRFRPNLTIEGAGAWAEDAWAGGRIRVGEVIFRAAKPSDRCVVTTTDQETGVRGKEPLRTLARHRNVNQEQLFGMNLIPDLAASGSGRRPAGTGEVAVGDEVTVLD